MPSLEEKVRLLTGETSFTTYAVESLGVEPMALSDGPIGIRGVADPPPVAAQLPNPTAVAATWDLELTARLGTLIGHEAKRLGIDVVLAPIVNIQRTPVGGRHFETYSEDPALTVDTMVAFVKAVQAEGVGVCVKHFVGNESETERTEYLARIPEQALREVYLAPFEAAVKKAGAWSIMAAYNRVEAGGEIAQATDHGYLINDVLKGEWGFDGVVVSDWLATKTTIESALGGLDLVMPGPGGPWEQKLLAAVATGDVPESVIDDKVVRLLRLAKRVGKLHDPAAEEPRSLKSAEGASRAEPREGDGLETSQASNARPAEAAALLREAVARASVVLRNESELLPLDPAEVSRIALIGPNAVEPFVQGGGSAFVNAPYLVTPEAGLREAFPDAEVTVHRGVASRRFAHVIDPELVTTADGTPGYTLELLDADGGAVGEPQVIAASEGWNRGIVAGAQAARVTARVTLGEPGAHRVEVGLVGIHTAWFDGELVSESGDFADSNVILNSSANHPAGPSAVFEVAEGETRVVEISVECQVVDAGAYSRFVRFELRHDSEVAPANSVATTANSRVRPAGTGEQTSTDDVDLEAAIAAASAADVAVVIIGTNEEVESEGWDRQSLALPGRQDELVRRVAAANPRTVVVVNAGAPVILPWLDEVPATLWWWLPGQEAGNGLADALTGATEPSGRLPWTLPAAEADVPVPHALPVDGVVEYTEGVHVGYRGWERLGRVPARPFGFGLGYSVWKLGVPIAAEEWGADDALPVTVALTNDGERDARGVVQFYLSGPRDGDGDGGWDRPARWLVGHAAQEVLAGRVVAVTLRIPRRAFQVWSVAAQQWITPSGVYTIRAASDARDPGQTVTITL
ncbi:beta-glucosidase family protein [Gryllotalpicola protaetiae]|uniref:Beta-glucosidase n=1 Tax=Gryllotalpicola protaetiae TaxID=2419771 RepID=A0A387BME7_9MICO|nr:glycoside hydrolase family 3 C-terminal domain-containing protein [Gryllotalpicola protaetiae]AYG03204.1 beta-glucosidase [Gryllotalpicola protaetiae]